MEDLANYLRSGFSEMHKQKGKKNFGNILQPVAVNERIQKMITKNRTIRQDMVFQNRAIPENMTPIKGDDKSLETTIEPTKKDEENGLKPEIKKRLEELKKWKKQKEMLKQQEKNKKPVFKVCGVSQPIGLGNLETVYKEIKGKKIKSSFAPIDHKFKPPPNIKPLPLGNKPQKPTRKIATKPKEITTDRIMTRSQTRKIETVVNDKKTVIKKQVKEKPKSLDVKKTVKQKTEVAKTNKTPIKQTKIEKKDKLDESSFMSPDYPSAPQTCNSSEKDEKTTPKNVATPPQVYTSPFVVVSRGKTNARKEMEARKSKGIINEKIEESSSPAAGAAYFQMLLDNQISDFRKTIETWEQYKESENLTEEASSLIDVAIGQTNLLINKKFMQFQGLIVSCREQNSDQPVKPDDLHGFWDMLTIQIENLNKRFTNLDNLKATNWEEVVPIQKKATKKTKPKQNNKIQASSKLRQAIQAARKKKMEENNELEIKVLPEIKTEIIAEKKTPNRRQSQIVNVKSSTKKRISSPGLMMMKVAQYGKMTETPGKSILKTGSKSAAKSHSKIVLFEDEVEPLKEEMRKINLGKTRVSLFQNEDDSDLNEEENDVNLANVLIKEKTPPRRSLRVSLKKS